MSLGYLRWRRWLFVANRTDLSGRRCNRGSDRSHRARRIDIFPFCGRCGGYNRRGSRWPLPVRCIRHRCMLTSETRYMVTRERRLDWYSLVVSGTLTVIRMLWVLSYRRLERLCVAVR